MGFHFFSNLLDDSEIRRKRTRNLQTGSRTVESGRRFYSPDTGRWLNRDPIGERGGMNVYAFVHNEPVWGIDPFGMDFICPGKPETPSPWTTQPVVIPGVQPEIPPDYVPIVLLPEPAIPIKNKGSKHSVSFCFLSGTMSHKECGPFGLLEITVVDGCEYTCMPVEIREVEWKTCTAPLMPQICSSMFIYVPGVSEIDTCGPARPDMPCDNCLLEVPPIAIPVYP